MSELTCPQCHHPHPIEALLASASGYSRVTNSGVTSCSGCGEPIEFRLRDSNIKPGYTSWAGSTHFDAVSSQRVHGLSLAWTADVLTATVGSRSFTLAPPPGSKAP